MHKITKKNPCSDLSDDYLVILREIVRMQMGKGLDYDSKIMDRARKRAVQRFHQTQKRVDEVRLELEQLEAEQMKKAMERLLEFKGDSDEILNELLSYGERIRLKTELEELSKESQALTKDDFYEVLSEFNKTGLTYDKRPRPILTSRGAQLLGKGFLARILQRLTRLGVGPHKIEEVGHGPWFSSIIRSYEAGDPYERLSIERSLLSTLERGGRFGKLNLQDLRVYESVHSTRVTFGILVDQSASMNRGGKLQAAVETSLALAELMKSQYPEDTLRIFIFSEEVREVVPWQLPDMILPMGYTDIRSALRAFRKAVAQQSGNKQAHLITDSAPNFEDGDYVGFDRALMGVMEEAKRYKTSGIILNIIMLDDDKKLREMAKTIARQNLGRVFFTRPGQLGEALVEDYLISKRELIRF